MVSLKSLFKVHFLLHKVNCHCCPLGSLMTHCLSSCSLFLVPCLDLRLLWSPPYSTASLVESCASSSCWVFLKSLEASAILPAFWWPAGRPSCWQLSLLPKQALGEKLGACCHGDDGGYQLVPFSGILTQPALFPGLLGCYMEVS